jgi:PAS domain S-box-containing protein
MIRMTRSTALRYGAALVFTALAVFLRWLLDPVMGDYFPLATLYGAVAGATLLGGYRPAVLSVVLGYFACDYLFIEVRGKVLDLDGRNLAGLILYLLSCAIIIAFGEVARAAHRRVEVRQSELEQALAQLRMAGRRARESEDRQRQITDLIPFGAWMTDASGDFIYLSSLLLEMVGQTVEEHKRAWPDTIHPDDAATMVEKWRRFVESGGVWDHEFRMRGKDGEYRTLHARGFPVRDGEGRVTGCVGFNYDITERKRAEEALRQTMEQMQIVTDSMAALVTRCSRDLKYLWVSKPYAEWINRPAGEIIGNPIVDVIGQEAFTHLHPRFEQVLSGRVVRYEEHIEFRGIGPRWISAVYTPTLGADGLPDGWVAVVRDVTEHKQLEQSVRESEQRFARFMHHLPGLAWIKDLQGRYVYANETAMNVFRCTRDQLYGRTDDEVFPPGTAAQFKQNDLRAISSGTGVQVIETLEHEDGIVHHSVVSKFPILGPDGSQALVGGMAIDVTDRLRAETVLAESEERFRQLAENVNEVFWMTDPQTTQLLYISPAYERVWGRSCESLYENPRSFMDTVHPDDRERVRIAVLENQSRGEETDKEYRVIRPDGSIRWVRDRAFPVKNAEDKFYRVVGIVDDFTERKLAEEALKEADRRKDEFLATLAHELRNPLAPIQHGLQIMRLASHDHIAVEQARTMMERQLQHFIRLVNDLLDLSRINTGKIELHQERIELADVVRSALETCEPLIKEFAHELIVTVPDGPLFVDADKTRLVQVLCNLLTNAAKFSDRGGRIWLTAEQQGGEAVVSVRDTGVGIPPQMLPKVFEVFTQVDRSLEKSHGGLGIGLSIVQRLVEMHGGTVEARSEGPGMGSEFVVRLPVVLSLVQGEEPDGDDPKPARPTARHRILVVDDNEDSARTLAMMLNLMGNEVRIAHDGLEAVAAASAYRPDLILLDIGMPRLNGYEACRRIREQPWGKGILIAAATGWGQEEDRRRSREAGFDRHLIKPVDHDALEKLLLELRASKAERFDA